MGESLAGFALYVIDDTLRFAVARWPETASVVSTPISAGDLVFTMAHSALGDMRGRALLRVDGRSWCTVDMSPTMARVGIGLDIGCDRGHQVSHEHQGLGAFRCSGHIANVEVEPGPQADGSIVNLPERTSQRA